MSTPIYGNVYQELAPLFTHTLYEQGVLSATDCVIGFEIVGGDTTFLSVQGTTQLHEYPYIATDVGTYTITVKAYFD